MGRRSQAYAFDVGTRGDVDTMCARVNDEFDSIDILINNAGVTRDGLFRKMDRGAWDEVINTNLSSVFDITQRFIDRMALRGWGRVINISSIVGRIGNFGQANYAAAKAGLIGFTKTLAREYARKGVTVNAIAPGFVRTRMLDGVPDKAMQTVLDTTPVGRLGDPMEIAASALYLASPVAGFVTGHVLDINGGMAM
jgi:NAD(P)-dependent dehydrogenase (short-subunit alcohol dehydrogenase family)